MTATVLIALVTFAAAEWAANESCPLAGVDRPTTLSSTCLSCHDGSVAPAVALHAADGRGAHPVSVRYAGRADVSIRPNGPLDPLVVLPAGRVECVTCHSGEGTGPHRTVLPVGALCLGCHDK
jgi:hypothetical protein